MVLPDIYTWQPNILVGRGTRAYVGKIDVLAAPSRFLSRLYGISRGFM